MSKHLLNLKAKSKDNLANGKPIGGHGRLSDERVKQIQRYYGLAITQNTLSIPNPPERKVNVAAYTMKKNIAILHKCVQAEDPVDFVHWIYKHITCRAYVAILNSIS